MWTTTARSRLYLTTKTMNSTSYHTIHQNEFEFVFVKGLVSVLVVCRPDVAGDGGCHSCISIPISRVSQKRTFIIQQAGERNKGGRFSYQQTKGENLVCYWQTLHCTGRFQIYKHYAKLYKVAQHHSRYTRLANNTNVSLYLYHGIQAWSVFWVLNHTDSVKNPTFKPWNKRYEVKTSTTSPPCY